MRFALLLPILLLAACAPREQEFRPLVSEPRFTKNEFFPGDETSLPLRSWMPKGKPRAVVIALHGFNDYSNAFASAAKVLNKRGVAMLAYDQRGFGATQEPGIWGGAENLKRDMQQAVRAAYKTYPHTPVYVLGESMGGAVAIAAFAEPGAPEVDGLILSAPAVWGDDAFNPFYRLSLWVMVHAVPDMKFTGEGLDIKASDNIEMLRALSKDPLVIKETRVDAMYGLVRLMDEAYEQGAHLDTPVLLLYGARDEVIPKPPVERLAQVLEGKARYAYYPAGYHMLLRDLQADVVLKDMDSWMNQPEEKLPSGLDR